MKVLTLGHSLSVDCGHMLVLVAEKEGYEDLYIYISYILASGSKNK